MSASEKVDKVDKIASGVWGYSHEIPSNIIERHKTFQMPILQSLFLIT